jgi:hypothetical protein
MRLLVCTEHGLGQGWRDASRLGDIMQQAKH